MKRFRLVVRVSDTVLDELGATDVAGGDSTGEDAVMKAVQTAFRSLGIGVEQVEGLDYWTDPPEAAP